MSAKQPKVVIIGGGTGLPVLLRGLKKYPIDLTAIVTVADDGGSSGRLRKELDIPPPGDIRNALAALSEVEPLVIELFQHRFKSSKELSGHSLGNLILAGMTSITGDFFSAIQELSKVLNVHGKVLPAARDSVVLHAEMEDGTIVSGESKIPYSGKRIKRVFLTPETAQPLPETIQEIQMADMIILGPGSLYTSILPNLIVPKLGNEICRSKARKVYVCNLMTQAGETLNYTASDHVQALYDHLNCAFIDTIIVNNKSVPEHVLSKYSEELAQPVCYDCNKLYEMGLEIVYGEILTFEDGVIRHDHVEISKILYSILMETVSRQWRHRFGV